MRKVRNAIELNSGSSVLLTVLKELGLLLISVVLFALSFPNPLVMKGIFILGFIALVPIFPVIHKSGWLKVCLYGILYGWVSYGVFNYWLTTFHPLAVVIVPSIYAFYFLLVFPLLKLADVLFKEKGFLVQVVIWVGYEYLRTRGFLGYPYGVIGYTQYIFLPFIQIAEITGVWGVTALVVFPSVYLGNGLVKGFSGLKEWTASHRLSGFIYAALFIANLVFGLITMNMDYGQPDAEGKASVPQWKVALVQHNADTWEGGFRAYQRNVDSMIRLSEEALSEAPDVDAVIWSETCVVPGIDWHTRYRTDQNRYQLVKGLTDYLSSKDVPFIFGNDDGQALLDENGIPLLDSRGNLQRVDYNAVIHFDYGSIQNTYRKIHMVPFTEYFPYDHIFPKFYALMVARDFHFWEHGKEYTVFDVRGVKISTPICFEDVFGDSARGFVKRGAEVIVNLTNDSWSGSVSAEMQHAAMAVFRAVENRRSMVRGTNAGITCTVLPNGKITGMAEPFTETYMIGSVPVYTGRSTLYTLWGELWGRIFLYGGLMLLLSGIIFRIIEYIRRKPVV